MKSGALGKPDQRKLDFVTRSRPGIGVRPHHVNTLNDIAATGILIAKCRNMHFPQMVTLHVVPAIQKIGHCYVVGQTALYVRAIPDHIRFPTFFREIDFDYIGARHGLNSCVNCEGRSNQHASDLAARTVDEGPALHPHHQLVSSERRPSEENPVKQLRLMIAIALVRCCAKCTGNNRGDTVGQVHHQSGKIAPDQRMNNEASLEAAVVECGLDFRIDLVVSGFSGCGIAVG